MSAVLELSRKERRHFKMWRMDGEREEVWKRSPCVHDRGPFPEVCFWSDLQQGGGEREGWERRRDE